MSDNVPILLQSQCRPLGFTCAASLSVCSSLLVFSSPASGLHFKTKAKMFNSLTETNWSLRPHRVPCASGRSLLRWRVWCADRQPSEIVLYHLCVYTVVFTLIMPFIRAIFPRHCPVLCCVLVPGGCMRSEWSRRRTLYKCRGRFRSNIWALLVESRSLKLPKWTESLTVWRLLCCCQLMLPGNQVWSTTFNTKSSWTLQLTGKPCQTDLHSNQLNLYNFLFW